MAEQRPPLDRLFNPKSVAIIGASASPSKAGFKLVETLSAFPGRVYPINPKADQILGLAAYPAIGGVPGPVDLVFLGIPAQACAPALREAVAAGVGAAIIVSGGFGEVDRRGRALQDEIATICRDGGLRLLGPNTSGFLSPSNQLFATFLPAARSLEPGPVGIVAQSGGVNISLAFSANELGLGVGLAVGLGNAVDIDAADLVDYLTGRDDIKVIALHLEGVVDGRRLFETVRRATAVKPVVTLPVGRNDVSAFAKSHTGNLMGSYRLTRAAMHQAGAVIVETTTDLLDAAHALARTRLPPKARPGAAILTGQAGPGLIMADQLKGAGVRLPRLSKATRQRIAGLLPPMTYTANPVDTGRPAATFGDVLAAVGADPAVDVVLTYALYEEDAVDPVAMFAKSRGALATPVVYGTGGDPASIGPITRTLEASGLPCYTAPDRAATAVRALVEDARARQRLAGRPIRPKASVRLDGNPLDEAAAKAVLGEIGIATPRRFVCERRKDAEAALRAAGGPVAVKVLDPSIAHKTEAGGVHLGVETRAQLAAALDSIDRIGGEAPVRYLVEEMAPPGLEMIIGGTNDPSYGPSVLVGLGGTAAEALGDFAMRLAPLTRRDAQAMLDELSGAVLLDGWRGAAKIGRAPIADVITRIGDLLVANPAIGEIDLNPVRAYPDRIIVLDAVILQHPAR